MSNLYPQWLDLNHLAKYASVSKRTLQTWIHQADNPLPAYQPGGKLLVRRAEFDAWVEGRKLQATDIGALVDSIVAEMGESA